MEVVAVGGEGGLRWWASVTKVVQVVKVGAGG